MNYDVIVIRYGEMTLKKCNYKYFLDKVNRDIRHKCAAFTSVTYKAEPYRFFICLNGENFEAVKDVLDTVPGLYSYSPCIKVEKNIDSIASAAIELINTEKRVGTFKVESHRGDKRFPMTSIEISQHVASLVLPKLENVTVDVHNPDFILNIDLRDAATYIATRILMGMGGYPAGIAGSGMLMLSGGIDSPVAGFLALRKGVNLTAIHYVSPPYTSDMALQKVIDLTERLCTFTLGGHIKLLVVPFTAIQETIHNKADGIYMITLTRRAMYKIAARAVSERGLNCIINGDSIGQVASQTLESIQVVNEVTNIPIIRPLSTYDKLDVIKIARKIGTYETSIIPYDDCCTVFVPKHPVIKPQIAAVLAEEEKCDYDELIDIAYQNIKEYDISNYKKTTVFEEKKFEI